MCTETKSWWLQLLKEQKTISGIEWTKVKKL